MATLYGMSGSYIVLMYGSNPYIFGLNARILRIFLSYILWNNNIKIFFILKTHCCNLSPFHGFIIFLTCTAYLHLYTFSNFLKKLFTYKHDIEMHMQHHADFKFFSLNVRICTDFSKYNVRICTDFLKFDVRTWH